MESSRKRWSLATKRLSLFLTSVAVACGLCELLLRVMGIGYGTVHMESSQILHHVSNDISRTLIRKTQLQLEWAWLHRGDERVRPTTGFVEENPDVSPPTDRYLKRLAAEIDQSGATLAIMAVPSKERTLRPHDRPGGPVFHDKVRQWADANAVAFIDLAPAFDAAAGQQLFFQRDIHFTADGHRVVVDQIAAAYSGVFRGRPRMTTGSRRFRASQRRRHGVFTVRRRGAH